MVGGSRPTSLHSILVFKRKVFFLRGEGAFFLKAISPPAELLSFSGPCLRSYTVKKNHSDQAVDILEAKKLERSYRQTHKILDSVINPRFNPKNPRFCLKNLESVIIIKF